MQNRGTFVKCERIENMIASNRLFLASLLISSTLLFSSYVYELIWDIKPCNLCILQRISIAGILIISLIGYLSPTKLLLIRVVIIPISFCFLLAGYHWLVQAGILNDPCLVPKNITSLKEFKLALNSPLPCSSISWSLLGLPASAFNFFTSGTLLTAFAIRIRHILRQENH